jgi:hypothetical protein
MAMANPPIILPPSANPDALVEAIGQALAADAPLLLEPGNHFTRPGHLQRIAVGAAGLRISSTGPSPLPINPAVNTAVIRRPRRAPDQPLPDFNFGLFFIPAGPTHDELAVMNWKPFVQPGVGAFEFGVVMRGGVEISRVLVDCNMHEQGLENAPQDAAEHSAMLGFSGFRYAVAPSPTGTPRFVYVGFDRVALHDMGFINGGFADDVWVSYSGAEFHPHIENVSIEQVASANRVNPRRATLSFSGLAHSIRIHDADIYRLGAEQDGDWKDAPRRDTAFSKAFWDLARIKAELMGFAVKGKVMLLQATALEATTGFQVHFCGGVIRDSTLRVAPEDSRFFRLDGIDFDHVIWRLPADAAGKVVGIIPRCRFNDTCIASFTNNAFQVTGAASSGQLIDSDYSVTEPGNVVTLTFVGCTYEPGFGSPALPATSIARVRERGIWTFSKADLAGSDPAQALPKANHPDVRLFIV